MCCNGCSISVTFYINEVVQMTGKERYKNVLSRRPTDCVPVSPDTSNMIPCRLTGRPFWDIYLYHKIPLWKAYIDCARHFGFDSFVDGSMPYTVVEGITVTSETLRQGLTRSVKNLLLIKTMNA